MSSFVVGIDVGGTNIKVGLINPRGRVVARNNLSTKSLVRNKKQLIDVIVGASHDIIKNNALKPIDIMGFGLGLPGLVNTHKGIVLNLTNIPGCKNIPLASIFKKYFKKPVAIDNDVNLMALAEWQFGAGRGFKNVFCLTLGTGVGGGMILDNQLYRGEGFSAGELGHVPLNENGPACNCGGRACLETYVGNQSLLVKVRRLFNNPTMALEAVARLAGQNNRQALRFWEETGAYIGLGLVSVVNLFNPERIVIGGGVANNWIYFLESMKATIEERAMKIPGKMVKLVKAQLGEDAGMIGAKVLVTQSAGSR